MGLSSAPLPPTPRQRPSKQWQTDEFNRLLLHLLGWRPLVKRWLAGDVICGEFEGRVEVSLHASKIVGTRSCCWLKNAFRI